MARKRRTACSNCCRSRGSNTLRPASRSSRSRRRRTPRSVSPTPCCSWPARRPSSSRGSPVRRGAAPARCCRRILWPTWPASSWKRTASLAASTAPLPSTCTSAPEPTPCRLRRRQREGLRAARLLGLPEGATHTGDTISQARVCCGLARLGRPQKATAVREESSRDEGSSQRTGVAAPRTRSGRWPSVQARPAGARRWTRAGGPTHRAGGRRARGGWQAASPPRAPLPGSPRSGWRRCMRGPSRRRSRCSPPYSLASRRREAWLECWRSSISRRRSTCSSATPPCAPSPSPADPFFPSPPSSSPQLARPAHASPSPRSSSCCRRA
mmetsp:Transcript_5623/g.16829  ORF Transcript_5623/g.16829 Transcript_5623/m.16829 type:complete len:326 (-) Transcript_5623:552-1529(-)